MKPLKQLVRERKIDLLHVSDDGEFVQYKLLPDGPIIGQWQQFDQVLMVVDRETVHENSVNLAPGLYDKVPPPHPPTGDLVVDRERDIVLLRNELRLKTATAFKREAYITELERQIKTLKEKK